MNDSISLPYILPSGGVYYNGEIPDGQVIIYPIRGEQEELLAGAGEENYTSVLRHLTGQLVKLPEKFVYLNLLITDWMALLLNIFALSYSPIITLRPTCPQCRKTNSITKSIGELECVNILPSSDPAQYREPLAISPLPKSQDVLTVHRLRLRDLEIIENYQRQLKNSNQNPILTYTLAQQIVSINGNGNLSDPDKMRWIRNALSSDLRFLRSEIQKSESGYDLRPTVRSRYK